MSDLREAAEMALEALEYESKRGNDNAYAKEREALRQALAQPECPPCTHNCNEGRDCPARK